MNSFTTACLAQNAVAEGADIRLLSAAPNHRQPDLVDALQRQPARYPTAPPLHRRQAIPGTHAVDWNHRQRLSSTSALVIT